MSQQPENTKASKSHLLNRLVRKCRFDIGQTVHVVRKSGRYAPLKNQKITGVLLSIDEISYFISGGIVVREHEDNIIKTIFTDEKEIEVYCKKLNIQFTT
jgi:ribosomal protein S16